MAFVKASGTSIGLEGPESESDSTLLLCNIQQLAPDAAPRPVRVDVQLVDPLVLQHEDPHDGPAVVSNPDLPVRKDYLAEPRSHLAV